MTRSSRFSGAKSSFHLAKALFRTAPLRWGLIGLFGGLCLGLGTWLVTARLCRNPSPRVPPPARVVPTRPAPAKPATSPDAEGLLSAAVAGNFIHARTQTERLKWVRQPEQVAVAMAEFFGSGRGTHEKAASLSAMTPADTGTMKFARFGVTMQDGSQRLLCVVEEDGAAKVDFKAYARHGSVPWEDLLAGKATEASEVRVLLMKSDYYNFEFIHDVRWQNFTATSPDLDASLQFYMARFNPDAKLLEKLDTRRPIRATVAIRASGDSHLKRQFEITRFRAAGWVLED